MTAVSIILAIGIFILAHELGHVLCAWLLRCKIEKIGVTLTPFPAVYVIADQIRRKSHAVLFLLSGFAVTCSIITGLYFSGLLFNYTFYMASTIQLGIETNPFQSDFTLLTEVKKYTPGWYLHLFIWGLLLALFYSPNLLYGYFLG